MAKMDIIFYCFTIICIDGLWAIPIMDMDYYPQCLDPCPEKPKCPKFFVEVIKDTKKPTCCPLYECVDKAPICEDNAESAEYYMDRCTVCDACSRLPCIQSCDLDQGSCETNSQGRKYEGDTWTEGCHTCTCIDGNSECMAIQCNTLGCNIEDFIRIEGECCPTCREGTIVAYRGPTKGPDMVEANITSKYVSTTSGDIRDTSEGYIFSIAETSTTLSTNTEPGENVSPSESSYMENNETSETNETTKIFEGTETTEISETFETTETSESSKTFETLNTSKTSESSDTSMPSSTTDWYKIIQPAGSTFFFGTVTEDQISDDPDLPSETTTTIDKSTEPSVYPIEELQTDNPILPPPTAVSQMKPQSGNESEFKRRETKPEIIDGPQEQIMNKFSLNHLILIGAAVISALFFVSCFIKCYIIRYRRNSPKICDEKDKKVALKEHTQTCMYPMLEVIKSDAIASDTKDQLLGKMEG